MNHDELIKSMKDKGITVKVDNGNKLEFSNGETYVKDSHSGEYKKTKNYMESRMDIRKLVESKLLGEDLGFDKLSKKELEKDLEILKKNYSPNFELDNDPYGYGYFFSEDMGGENNLEDCIVIYPPKADADIDESDKYTIVFDPQGDSEEHYVDSLADIEAIAWYKEKKKQYFGGK